MLQFHEYNEPSYTEILSGIENPKHSIWNIDDDAEIQTGREVETKGLYGIYDIGYEGPLNNDMNVVYGATRHVKQVLTDLSAPTSFFDYKVESIVSQTLFDIDYQLPYLLFEDTGVEYVPAPTDQLFRVNKKSSQLFNSILNPELIEIYRVKMGFDFKNFFESKKLYTHPNTQRLFAEGPFVIQGADGAPLHFDLKVVNQELVKTLWAAENTSSFSYFCEEIRDRLCDDIEYDYKKKDQYLDALEQRVLADNHENILDYVKFVILLTISWLKSPMAVRYLVDCHAIYNHLLYEGDDGRIKVHAESGGFVVMLSKVDNCLGYSSVTDIEFFTKEDLDIIPATVGTCRSCGDSFHCSKYVNISAMENPTCYCGEKVNPLSEVGYDPYGHDSVHTRRECQDFFTLHKPVFGHYCQRCLYKIASKLHSEVPCYRTRCPKVNCRHHQGMVAHMDALKAGRINLLGSGERKGFMNINLERRV